MAKVTEPRFCKACLDWRPETEFYFRAGRQKRRNKCKRCEKQGRPVVRRVKVEPEGPNPIQQFLCGRQIS
jgi:hypothetical protein